MRNIFFRKKLFVSSDAGDTLHVANGSSSVLGLACHIVRFLARVAVPKSNITIFCSPKFEKIAKDNSISLISSYNPASPMYIVHV